MSSDGTLLYAGLDGGQLVEFRIVRQVGIPNDPYGTPYNRVYDLAIDPFDSDRILVLAGGNAYGNSGALLM